MPRTPSYMIDQQKNHYKPAASGTTDIPVNPGIPSFPDPDEEYMLKEIYDPNGNNIVDDSERLGGIEAKIYKDHILKKNNPHDVTKTQIGLGDVENISPENMPISDDVRDALAYKENHLGLPSNDYQVLYSTITGVRGWMDINAIGNTKWGDITGDIDNQTDLSTELNNRENSLGLPTANGQVLASTTTGVRYWADIGSGFILIGSFDPSLANEYPDVTGLDYGSFWVVDTISTPSGSDPTRGDYYIFGSGDLSGKTIYIGDYMLWSSTGWILVAANIDPSLYYKLDGTLAITAPFAGGGQQIKNIAYGTSDNDGTTVNQVYDFIDDALEIGRINRRKG